MTAIGTSSSLTLAGTDVHLLGFDDAVSVMIDRATDIRSTPLAVASINLDHVHHFGTGSRWGGSLDRPDSSIEWLNLLDGAPVVSAVRRETGETWPRLAGSDLIGPLLDRAAASGLSVGFLGGAESTHETVASKFASTRPDLRLAGFWAPSREDLADPARSAEIAAAIAEAGTDILVVGLGKPRQELWIAEYGALTGARLLLAFGAVVDFLAERVSRAPEAVARLGVEWAWRLGQEPRRLARRYLVDGPPAYLALRRTSPAVLVLDAQPIAVAAPETAGVFVAAGDQADVTAVIVTYNNVDDVEPLIAGLRGEAAHLRLRVVVMDNGSSDGTLAALEAHADVIARPSGGNLGYAGGINAAAAHLGDTGSVLVLNPDLSVEPGAIVALVERMNTTGAGIVVPLVTQDDGSVYPSLRREPTTSRMIGDALVGRRLSHRPEWLSEIDYLDESYRYAHRIEWATGAALLVRRDLADRLGPWDERFFLYSEEVDYFRRARDAGATAWFEPAARVHHRQGGSGASDALVALMAVNRVRYADKVLSPAAAGRMRAGVALQEALRVHKSSHRLALTHVLSRSSWRRLPRAVRPTAVPFAGSFPTGAIIIPAHNEAAVIGRTLRAIELLAGHVQIIVAVNGSTDDTAAIARGFGGVQVIEVDAASKVAAINAADEVATEWPRLYLDADIRVPVSAVRDVFTALASDVDGGPLAARPAFVYDTRGASVLVRAYYRARNRVPSLHHALWGAGAYAVSERGHARFGVFPPVTGDDLWIDAQFSGNEKAVLPTRPVLVSTPRRSRDLLAILRRAHRGVSEAEAVSTSGGTVRELVRSVRGPSSLVDAVVFAAFAAIARRSRVSTGWERDDSSRQGVTS